MVATPSPNLADSHVLAGDATFQGRIEIALVTNAIAVAGNSASSAAAIRFASNVVNSPATFAPLFARTIAANTTVITDATVGGTVPLTGANVAAQGALVTDPHLTAALVADWSTFFLNSTTQTTTTTTT
jgi:hypothetical protein